MKADMGIADEMVLLVLGSCTCSAQSAPKRTYQQFMVAKSEGLRWKSARRGEMGVAGLITKHCCRSGKISLVEEQQQDVATGVSFQLPFLRKAVKSVLNYSKSAIVSAALKIRPPKRPCTRYF